jgi:deoxyribonuclease-4
LGGQFEHLAELIALLRKAAPLAACIDTCHTHVSGYDLVSEEGYELTLRHLDATIGLANVPVWHCNDAKAGRGSGLDRHEHIGKGTIGLDVFRRLLNDPRLAHAAFIAETPIDQPGDDLRNVEALKACVNEKRPG